MISPHDIWALLPSPTMDYKSLRSGMKIEKRPRIERPKGSFVFLQLPPAIRKAEAVALRNQINAAVRNDDISEILIYCDCPGGTVAGTDDLARTVARAAKVKRVTVFVEDQCTSAAYYVASQATQIVATPSSMIGSIGVLIVIEDFSELKKGLGIKTFVVRTGALKGGGGERGEVTDEHIGELQRVVDEFGRQFLVTVANGRGKSMSDANLLAMFDGRVLIGEDAKNFGLVDRIALFEDVLDEMCERCYENFSHLRGHAALKKFNELVSDDHSMKRPGADDETERFVRRQLQQRYPSLAKHAADKQADEEERYRERKAWNAAHR